MSNEVKKRLPPYEAILHKNGWVHAVQKSFYLRIRIKWDVFCTKVLLQYAHVPTFKFPLECSIIFSLITQKSSVSFSSLELGL